MGAGAWGVVAVPLFSFERSIFYNRDAGDGAWFDLAWALAGLLTIVVWTGGLTGLLFFVLNKLNLLRLSDEIIEGGIDIHEHGEAAYVIQDIKKPSQLVELE